MYTDPDGQFIQFLPAIALSMVQGGSISALVNVWGQFNHGFGKINMSQVGQAFWSGALSAGAFSIIHEWLPDWGDGKILAHAAVGGFMAASSGGDVSKGFLIAGLTQTIAPGIDQIEKGTNFSVLRLGAASAFGAGVAYLTGDDPVQGALIAGFSRAFNDDNTYMEQMAQGERQLAGNSNGELNRLAVTGALTQFGNSINSIPGGSLDIASIGGSLATIAAYGTPAAPFVMGANLAINGASLYQTYSQYGLVSRQFGINFGLSLAGLNASRFKAFHINKANLIYNHLDK